MMETVKDILEQFKNSEQTKPDLIQLRLENNNYIYLECVFTGHKYFNQDLLNRNVLGFSTLRSSIGRILRIYIEEQL